MTVIGGIILVIIGCCFLAAQYLSGTPHDRGYAHAITIICAGWVLTQYGLTDDGNLLLQIGLIASVVVCVAVSIIAYEKDTVMIARRQARRATRGERFAEKRITKIYDDIYRSKD